MSFKVYTFYDKRQNKISYLFNPSKRESDGEGPAILDQLIETAEDPSSSFSNTTTTNTSTKANEPKPGTILFNYTARDGALVRYTYDPTARNGKQYVVAIHREPNNWQRLKEEDLGVADEERLREMYDEEQDEDKIVKGAEEAPEDEGVSSGSEQEMFEQESEQGRRWARERAASVAEDEVRQSKRRDSMLEDESMRMDVDVSVE